MRDIIKNSLLLSALVLIAFTFSFIVASNYVNAQTYYYPELENQSLEQDSGTNYDFFSNAGSLCDDSYAVERWYWDGSAWDDYGTTSSFNCVLGWININFNQGDGYYAISFATPNNTPSESIDDSSWTGYAYFLVESGVPSLSPAPTESSPFTRVVSMNSPENNETVSSTTVEFDVDYISNVPVPDEICIRAISFTDVHIFCEDINSTGELNFSTSTTLLAGRQYSWTVVISQGIPFSLSSTELGRGGPNTFNVIVGPNSIDESHDNPIATWMQNAGYDVSTTSATSSATNPQNLHCPGPDSWLDIQGGVVYAFCEVIVFLFVPGDIGSAAIKNQIDILSSRFPFSVVSNTYNQFTEGMQIAESDPMELSFFWQGEETVVISESTYHDLVGEDTANGFRSLVGTFLWLLFGLWAMFFIGRLVESLVTSKS